MLLYWMSEEENSLLETIKIVNYGEIYGVHLEQGPITKEVEISEHMLELFEKLRKGATIDVLTIHQGEPCMAEIDGKVNGFNCRKKLKFPTE